MSRAQIKVNGTIGSDDDIPINVAALLTNNGDGGETTWTWAILDQPLGAADALSATNIPNPTLTPTKEGTYLLRLVVNQGLATEKADQVVVGIRQLKTGVRIPAAGETTENGARGWSGAVESILQLVDRLRADPGVMVMVAKDAHTKGSILSANGQATIKAGLPGEETLLEGWLIGLSPELPYRGRLVVSEGAIDGSASVGVGDLFFGTFSGRFSDAIASVGTPAVGSAIWCDGSAPSDDPPFMRRIIGRVVKVDGANYYMDVHGEAIWPQLIVFGSKHVHPDGLVYDVPTGYNEETLNSTDRHVVPIGHGVLRNLRVQTTATMGGFVDPLSTWTVYAWDPTGYPLNTGIEASMGPGDSYAEDTQHEAAIYGDYLGSYLELQRVTVVGATGGDRTIATIELWPF